MIDTCKIGAARHNVNVSETVEAFAFLISNERLS